MKRSKKVTIGILIFFVIVATVIGGRTAMGVYFKKKFGKRPPPGVVVEIVQVKEFSKTIESYCTALVKTTTRRSYFIPYAVSSSLRLIKSISSFLDANPSACSTAKTS